MHFLLSTKKPIKILAITTGDDRASSGNVRERTDALLRKATLEHDELKRCAKITARNTT